MLDYLFQNALIVDGTGKPGQVGDLGVIKGRIRLLGLESGIEAGRVFNAKGLVLAPGFIDIHGHSDLHLLDYPDSLIKLSQGVTTDTGGNCGFSAAPLSGDYAIKARQNLTGILGEPESEMNFSDFASYADTLDAKGLTGNLAAFVGHGTLRTLVAGLSEKRLSPGELAQMGDLLAQSLEQGAMGLSSGLIYLPACYSDTEELISLARVLAQKGGIYVSHIRNESTEVLPALKEAILIGQKAGAPVQVSHLKISGKQNWGLTDKVVELLEQARKQGLDVTCDVYPYTASATTLAAVLPPWALEGGAARIMERLKQKDLRARIKDEIIKGLPGWHDILLDSSMEKVRIAGVQSADLKHLEGGNLADLAEKAGVDPFDFLFDLLIQDNCSVSAVFEMMDQKVMEKFLSLPFAMIGSDGIAAGSKPHPRLYGTFPRVVGRLALGRGIFSLSEAVHKMTGMPAARLGLKKRGMLKEGFIADLVLFDPKEFIDTSTYDDPCQTPPGMELVMVNGEPVMEKGLPTGSTPGRFLRRSE